MLLARTPTTALRIDFQRNAAVGILANSKMYRTIDKQMPYNKDLHD